MSLKLDFRIAEQYHLLARANIIVKQKKVQKDFFVLLEQVTGIGPVSLAWEAKVLPLNYTCIFSFVLCNKILSFAKHIKA